MLTDAEKRFYKENGYILFKNVFTTEQIEECSKAYDNLFELKSRKSNLEAIWEGDWKQDEKASTDNSLSVQSIHNLQCHDAIFTKMLLNEKLMDAVSDLIESPNVLLHHTKAHVKPPGKGAPFPTHQTKFPLKDAIPVMANKGDVLIFSYLLVHGSYSNTSDRTRRMLIFQLMSAEDEPLKKVHLSPCHGMVLRGRNSDKNADIDKRHEQ